MAKYIEREVFREVLRKSHNAHARTSREVSLLARDVRLLNEQPAADVAPVVHGRWIGLEYDGYADGFPVYNLWECSECGEEVRGEDVPDTHPYCNGCGAKMDLE